MPTETTDGEQLVRDFHRRVLTDNDLDAAEELLAEDYVEHNPMLPDGEIRGRETMNAFWADMFDGVSDLEIAEGEVISAGNRVVTRHVGRGTHDGEFMGIEPTGNTFEVDGIDCYHIEDGKIAEGWVLVDSLGMLQQLGAFSDVPPSMEA